MSVPTQGAHRNGVRRVNTKWESIGRRIQELGAPKRALRHCVATSPTMGWNIGTCSARKRLRRGRRWCGFCGGPRGCFRTHLAKMLPTLLWQPTDADPRALASIAAHQRKLCTSFEQRAGPEARKLFERFLRQLPIKKMREARFQRKKVGAARRRKLILSASRLRSTHAGLWLCVHRLRRRRQAAR